MEARTEHQHMIMPDIEAFVSPIDGSVVGSRSRLREHERRHGVTNASDFTQEWKKAAEKRADYYTEDKAGKRDRIEALKSAVEKHRR